MRAVSGLVCVLVATAVAAGLSIAAFFLPRNSASGLVFWVFLVGTAAALWYGKSVIDERRRGRVDGLQQVGQRRPAMALYDQETGLLAGWYFKLRLQEEIARAARYGLPFGLMMINAASDRTDRKSAARLISSMASTFRATDLIGHVDGEARYAVLLPNTDAESSRKARERLLGALVDGAATVGLACYPDDATDWRELLTKAGASPAEFYGLTGGEISGEGETAFETVVPLELGRASAKETTKRAA